MRGGNSCSSPRNGCGSPKTTAPRWGTRSPIWVTPAHTRRLQRLKHGGHWHTAARKPTCRGTSLAAASLRGCTTACTPSAPRRAPKWSAPPRLRRHLGPLLCDCRQSPDLLDSHTPCPEAVRQSTTANNLGVDGITELLLWTPISTRSPGKTMPIRRGCIRAEGAAHRPDRTKPHRKLNDLRHFGVGDLPACVGHQSERALLTIAGTRARWRRP